MRGSEARGGISSSSPEGVEAALEERRAFFLGGIAGLALTVRYVDSIVSESKLTARVSEKERSGK